MTPGILLVFAILVMVIVVLVTEIMPLEVLALLLRVAGTGEARILLIIMTFPSLPFGMNMG